LFFCHNLLQYSVVTGVSLVYIRLLPSSTSDFYINRTACGSSYLKPYSDTTCNMTVRHDDSVVGLVRSVVNVKGKP